MTALVRRTLGTARDHHRGRSRQLPGRSRRPRRLVRPAPPRSGHARPSPGRLRRHDHHHVHTFSLRVHTPRCRFSGPTHGWPLAFGVRAGGCEHV